MVLIRLFLHRASHCALPLHLLTPNILYILLKLMYFWCSIYQFLKNSFTSKEFQFDLLTNIRHSNFLGEKYLFTKKCCLLKVIFGAFVYCSQSCCRTSRLLKKHLYGISLGEITLCLKSILGKNCFYLGLFSTIPTEIYILLRKDSFNYRGTICP